MFQKIFFSIVQSQISFCQPKDILNKFSGEDNCFLIITDNINDALKYNREHLFLLIVARHDEPVAEDVGKSFTEITKQMFSEYTFCLYKKVGIH